MFHKINILTKDIMQRYYRFGSRNHPDKYTNKYRVQKEFNKLQSFISLTRDDILLDMACGTGRWSMKFSPLCKQIVAFDKDKEQIVQFHNKMMKEKIKNIHLSSYSVQSFPFEIYEKSFTKVYIGALFQYLKDEEIDDLLERMKQSLKKFAIVITKESVTSERFLSTDGDIIRTEKEILHMFHKHGFILLNVVPTDYLRYQRFYVWKVCN